MRKRREGEKRNVLKEKNVRMDKTSFLLPALIEQKLLESQVYKEHYEGKVKCEKHIEEKVGEILPGKIDKVLAINTTFIAIKIQIFYHIQPYQKGSYISLSAFEKASWKF